MIKTYSIMKEGKSYDRCILCGDITIYTTDTHIDHRVGYVEGAGQLCYTCFTKGSSDSREMLLVPVKIIKDNPNDMELGKKIREFYLEHI